MSVPLLFRRPLGSIAPFDIRVKRVSKKNRAIKIAWTNALNARDTLRVTFRELYTNPAPVEDGTTLELFDANKRVFGGIVDSPTIEQEGDSPFLIYDCQAQDYSAIPQRRVVAAAYDNLTVGSIVADIVAGVLAGEGISVGEVEDGPIVARAVFPNIYVDQAFNELAELSGMTWWIDPNRVLYFKHRGSVVAPTAITDTNYVSMRVSSTREQYRNTQIVRAGTDLTDPRSESFTGDGTRRVFNVAYDVGTAPTITVNGLDQTVGIQGVDADKEWYWNKGKTEIVQSDAGTVLTEADVLIVTYEGLVPIIIEAQDDLEVSTRSALDGGSGKWEHVEDRPNIDAIDLALETADQLLARHGRITKILEINTRVNGLRAGQLLTVTNTKLGINGTFLIESVSAAEWIEPDHAGNPNLMYSVKALEGDFAGGWLGFFERLAAKGRDYVIRENEVLVVSRRHRDNVACSDVLTTTTGTSVENRAGFAIAGFSEAA